MRKVTPVKLKNLTFGDGNIYIQSMLNTKSTDVEGSVLQAKALSGIAALTIWHPASSKAFACKTLPSTSVLFVLSID